MENVAIYFRYSSSVEAQKQNSEKRQRFELLEFALNKGWNIVFNNGDRETSGDKTKPKLEELKKEVADGLIKVDVVLVSSFDRLTRKDSLEYSDDVAWIRDAGAKLSILDKGGETIDLNDNQRLLLLQMEVYAANQYLKDLASKTASGQTARFKRGDLGFSNVPFGFDRNGKSIKANEDMDIVKQIFVKFCETSTLSDCIPLLEMSKKYGGGDSGVNISLIKRILRLPLYIGKRAWGVEGCGSHFNVKGSFTGAGKDSNRLAEAAEVIDTSQTIGSFVDEELFYKANSILDHNKILFSEGKRRKDKRSTYRYSGLVRCDCGRKMAGQKTKKGWLMYRCPDSKVSYKECYKTGGKSISEEEVKEVRRYARDILQEDEEFHRKNFAKYVAWLKKRSIASKAGGAVELQELELKKKRLKLIVEQTLNNSSGEVSQAMLEIIKEKQEEVAYEESRLQQLAEEGDSLEELFEGSTKLENPQTQRRLEHIREFAFKVINTPELHDDIFREYFGLLKMMNKNGDLAPVYLGEVRIKFKKGTDRNNRRRNIPAKFMLDIQQTGDTLEVSGSKVQTSICLHVKPTWSLPVLVFTAKRRNQIKQR